MWTPSSARALAMASPMPTLAPVITATLSRRCRSIISSSLFDDWDLAAVDRRRDGHDEDDAEHDLLGEDVDAEKGHARPHDRDEERADQGPPDASDAAGNGGAADDDGGDGRQQQLVGEGGRSAGESPGENDPGECRATGRKHKGNDLLPVDLDAGGVGGRLAGADRRAVAAEGRPALDEVDEEEDHR